MSFSRTAPSFWWRHRPSPAARLLAPLGFVYGAVTAARMARAGERAACPVICIGNLTAGGAGKTPTAIAVAELLARLGERPAFLSRGYGGRLAGPVEVDPAAHGAADVGDEPLLLARHRPVIVARDRVAGAADAAEAGASVIVMDDGLQNPSLIKDLALAVVDGAGGIGNGLPLPAGPLRAPAGRQLDHVHALVIVGEGRAGRRVEALARGRGLPVLRAALMPDEAAAGALAGRRVLAFAGIGRPQKFFSTLTAIGADVAETVVFEDHHPYTAAELTRLAFRAAAIEARPVTTEKDAVRLSPDLAALLPELAVLGVRHVFEEEEAVTELLRGALARGRR